MKLGYHDIRVVSYTTGVNNNATKLMEITVANEEGETEVVTMYFSGDGIKYSLEQLRELGWHKGHEEGLDAIIDGAGRIEVYEEKFEDRKGNIRMNQKARFVSNQRRSQVVSAMTRDAASKWLDSMDRTPTEDPHQQPPNNSRGW